MQEAQIKYPQYLDDPRPVLLWTIDEVIPFTLLVGTGFVLGRIMLFLVLSVAFILVWRRLRDRMPDGYLIHRLYHFGIPVPGNSFVNPYDEEIRSR